MPKSKFSTPRLIESCVGIEDLDLTEDLQSVSDAMMTESDEIADCKSTAGRKKWNPYEFKIREDLVIKTILR